MAEPILIKDSVLGIAEVVDIIQRRKDYHFTDKPSIHAKGGQVYLFSSENDPVKKDDWRYQLFFNFLSEFNVSINIFCGLIFHFVRSLNSVSKCNIDQSQLKILISEVKPSGSCHNYHCGILSSWHCT